MSVEENNKEVISRWIEALNRQDPSRFEKFLSDDYILHSENGQELKGKEILRQLAESYRVSFPDRRYTIEDMVAEGDKVAVRYTMTATHSGEFMGIAPTGKKIKTKLAMFYRLVDGKIVDVLSYSDQLALFQQLGATPPIK